MPLIKQIIIALSEFLLLDKFGRKVLQFFAGLGESSMLLYRSVKNLRYIVRDRYLIVEQMSIVGVNSIPLVVVTASFAGMVAAVQAGYQLEDFGSPSMFLGSSTSRAIVIELAPVLTGLVLAGRFGASIAAEIGTMKVTEQIDALETMAIDPIRYLATPRIIAGIVMMPILIIFADLIAMSGSLFIGYTTMDVSPQAFFASVEKFMVLRDVLSGLLKALMFGGSTALIGCYVGFATEGGAEGVGMATIRAFVLSSAAILVNDYIVASVILL
ncbi:ABC transporter permease [bacterium]|nr:ABC transporter permease [bacterium]